MTYVTGKSGNPAGRRPGSRNKATLAMEALLDGEGEAVIQRLATLAKLGDVPAGRTLLDRILPRRRDVPVQFALPMITSAADLPAACAAICDGILTGDLTPIEAERLTRTVEAMGRILRPHTPDQRSEPLASATNLQAGEPAACPAAPPKPAVPDEPPPALTGDLQADRAPDRPAPSREPAAPAEPALASATNLQADEPAACPAPSREPAAPAEAPLASATNLQADEPAASAPPSREPAAPLASATNLQADRASGRPRSSAWMREFLGELYDDEPEVPPEDDPARGRHDNDGFYSERTMDRSDGPPPPPQRTGAPGSNWGKSASHEGARSEGSRRR